MTSNTDLSCLEGIAGSAFEEARLPVEMPQPPAPAIEQVKGEDNEGLPAEDYSDEDEIHDDEILDDEEYMPDDEEFAPFPRESSSEYRQGGFHPIILGDYIGSEKRLRVVHKLGHGGFATVWLCRDTHEEQWKAVKVMSANVSTEDCTELRAVKFFANESQEALDAGHIVLPSEHFWINGPNGRHLCLVLPVLGASISQAWATNCNNQEWRKKVSVQLIEAMAFMHSVGVCHGDYRPSNILMHTRGLEKLSEAELVKLIGEPKIEVFPGRAGPHTPQYLVGDPCLRLSPELLADEIGVIDFGVAFHVLNPPKEPSIFESYQSPELMFSTGALGTSSDIWALGCTLFYFNINRTAFEVDGGVAQWAQALEVSLGPMPEPYRSRWAEATGEPIAGAGLSLPEGCKLPRATITPQNFEEEMQKSVEFWGTTDPLIGLMTEDYGYMLETRKGAAEAERESERDDEKPEEEKYEEFHFSLAAEEAQQLKDLLMRIWTWQPENRPSAASLLDDPWFKGCRVPRSGRETSQGGWTMGRVLKLAWLSTIRGWFRSPPALRR